MTLYQWLCLLGIQGAVTLVLSRVISKKMGAADAKAEQAKKETVKPRKKRRYYYGKKKNSGGNA